MKLYRIKAVMMRHLLQMGKDFSKIFDLFYWPLIDIFIWGFTLLWVEKTTQDATNIGFMILAALSLWSVVWRSNIEISLNFLEELWSRNLVNLFATPLSVAEWVIGMMLLSFLRSIVVFFYVTCMIWVLYGFNVLSVGFSLIPFFIVLMVSGWIIGLFITAFLVYFGLKVQSFVWVIGWVFSLFGAVFYPLNILPHWAQIIGYALPLSYAFEGLRSQIETGLWPTWYLWMAGGLDVIYLCAALLFFTYMFNKSRMRGLAHLEVG